VAAGWVKGEKSKFSWGRNFTKKDRFCRKLQEKAEKSRKKQDFAGLFGGFFWVVVGGKANGCRGLRWMDWMDWMD
jgi:hypothetical protein